MIGRHVAWIPALALAFGSATAASAGPLAPGTGILTRVRAPEVGPAELNPQGPRVVVIVRRGQGDPPPRSAIVDLLASIEDGLVRSGARIVNLTSLGMQATDCAEGECGELLRETSSEVDYVLWASLSASDREYTIELNIEGLSDPSSVNAFRKRCALCGLREACELIEEGAFGLLDPLKVELVQPPVLLLESTPSGARVVIDGEFVGLSPVERVLAPGRHRLEITASGYVDVVEGIDATEGERRVVKVLLAEIPPLPPLPPKPRLNGWIPLGIGVPTLIGGIVLVALDERAGLGCGLSNSGCDGQLNTSWAAAGTLVTGAVLTTLGAVLVHRLRESKRARRARAAEELRVAPGARPEPAEKKEKKKKKKEKKKKK